MSGSAVTGEWSARSEHDGWRFFSDLDIGVVREPKSTEYEQQLSSAERRVVDREAQLEQQIESAEQQSAEHEQQLRS